MKFYNDFLASFNYWINKKTKQNIKIIYSESFIQKISSMIEINNISYIHAKKGLGYELKKKDRFKFTR